MDVLDRLANVVKAVAATSGRRGNSASRADFSHSHRANSLNLGIVLNTVLSTHPSLQRQCSIFRTQNGTSFSHICPCLTRSHHLATGPNPIMKILIRDSQLQRSSRRHPLACLIGLPIPLAAARVRKPRCATTPRQTAKPRLIPRPNHPTRGLWAGTPPQRSRRHEQNSGRGGRTGVRVSTI